MPQVVPDIPDDLLLALREQPGEFAQAVRLAAALHYLREKRLSLGQATRLAGLTRLDFLAVVTARGIPIFDLMAADAVAEVAAAQHTAAHDCQ